MTYTGTSGGNTLTGCTGGTGTFAAGTACSNAALLSSYPAVYLYFPVGALFNASSAGWYYTEMSSKQQGVVFNNTYQSEQPAIPSSPEDIVATGPGLYAQTTAAVTALNTIVAGGSLGANGAIRLYLRVEGSNNANNKTYFAGFSDAQHIGSAFTTTSTTGLINTTRNAGVLNRQISVGYGSDTQVNLNNVLTTIDTSVNKTYSTKLQLAQAHDYVAIAGISIEKYPFA